MTAISAMTSSPSWSPAQRTVNRTDTGFATSFSRSTAQGDITGGATFVRGEDGGGTLSITRTGPQGQTKEITRDLSAEDVASVKSRLHDLGQRLSENPVTLPNGRVADGRRLLNIKV